MNNLIKTPRQEALEQYFRIARQWNGHVTGVAITVGEGNEILGTIKYDMSLSANLRIKASRLQREIILNNTSNVQEAIING